MICGPTFDMIDIWDQKSNFGGDSLEGQPTAASQNLEGQPSTASQNPGSESLVFKILIFDPKIQKCQKQDDKSNF